MKIDLLLDPFETSWSELVEVALAAESLGFDGLWTWDHLAGEVHGANRVLESWTVLCAIAARTSRVTIGPLVLNVGNRRPGVLAVMAATLQEVSDGRLMLGLGAGGGLNTPYHREQLALGAEVPDDPRRRQQVLDTIRICREVWTGTTRPMALANEQLSAGDGFLSPVPRPPIIVGGFGARMAELAGSAADGFNTQAGHPRLAELVSIARSAHQGRPGDFEISGFASLEPRWVEEAEDRLDRLIMIVSPRSGTVALTDFATAVGLSSASSSAP
ncbi:MAG: LLM class flavin-dependent oxidoreductase [Acidimicrobiales bacterium]